MAAVCRDVSVCPLKTDVQGDVTQATSCTTGSLVPTVEELTQGKSLSCACGGDAATEQLCQARGESGVCCGHDLVRAALQNVATDVVLALRTRTRARSALLHFAQLLPETRIRVKLTADEGSSGQKASLR
jgi:hypothetical protein